jgi:hypothetical protein
MLSQPIRPGFLAEKEGLEHSSKRWSLTWLHHSMATRKEPLSFWLHLCPSLAYSSPATDLKITRQFLPQDLCTGCSSCRSHPSCLELQGSFPHFLREATLKTCLGP